MAEKDSHQQVYNLTVSNTSPKFDELKFDQINKLWCSSKYLGNPNLINIWPDGFYTLKQEYLQYECVNKVNVLVGRADSARFHMKEGEEDRGEMNTVNIS